MTNTTPPPVARGKLFAVAPMMDWTDRHARVFHRTLTARAILNTEMVTEMAVRHRDATRLLGFDAQQNDCGFAWILRGYGTAAHKTTPTLCQ